MLKVVDFNMIFIFLCLIAMNIFAIIMPKRITRIEIYATCFFAEGLQFIGLMAQMLMYPAVNTIFLNYFPFHKRIRVKIAYIVGWSLFSVSFEWLSLQTSFFYYTSWKLWYSASLYPIIFYILYANLKLVRKLVKT